MNDKLNSEMIHHLDHDGKRIILVGTAHVSSESVDLVEAVIADVKPDTVCVELCESRAQAIRQKDRWQEMDIIKVIKEKKAFLLLSNLMLASFQKRIANRLEVSPWPGDDTGHELGPGRRCCRTPGRPGYPHHLVADLAQHGAVG
jgi:pheromone shutdown protein TraB